MKLNANEKIILARSMAGLAGQGGKSRRYDPTADMFECLYRGPRGLKCAIGHCIDDEFYDEGLEGHVVSDDCITDAVIRSNPNLDPSIALSIAFLERLQNSHDQADYKSFQENFRNNLIKYGLVAQ